MGWKIVKEILSMVTAIEKVYRLCQIILSFVTLSISLTISKKSPNVNKSGPKMISLEKLKILDVFTIIA